MTKRKPSDKSTEDSARTTKQAAKKAVARPRPSAGKADGESAVLAKIAAMPGSNRAMGERLHAIIKAQNNRVENSHQPSRLREKVMRRFKSPGHAQRFLSAFGVISSHFRVGRHLYRASGYRAVMKLRFAIWQEAIGVLNKQ